MRRKTKKQGGFTVVETLITIFVTVVFIQAFYTLFNVVVVSDAGAVQQSNASAYAYWYLRAWTSENSLFTRECDSSTDLVTYPSASGATITTINGSNASFPLPEPVTLVGKLYRPEGCLDDNAKPIKLEATVTYGASGTQVKHAVYIP